MFSLGKVQSIIFCPLYPVLIFLFLSITTLHVEVPLLVKLHIESLTLLWALCTSIIHFLISEKFEYDNNNIIIFSLLIGLMFISTPLLSSFSNQDQLNVIGDKEYQTLFKMILFLPCMVMILKNEKWRELTVNFLIFFYSLFAAYFLYRYLILHEVRDYDLRPQLKIRHGDANFLCTFFSMMIPVSLMQAWKVNASKNKLTFFLYLATALLLLVCVFLTESRMGLLATIIGISYLITRSVLGVSKKLLSTLALIGIIFIAFSGERIVQRFTQINDKSNSDRFLSWKNGYKVFADAPVFGKGIHKAKDTFYLNTGFPHFQSEAKALEVHNTFLKTLAELGLVGLVVFCIIFFWPWWKSMQLKTDARYFLISSMLILTLSILTIGLNYKDLFILHLFFVASLATFYTNSKSEC